MQICLKFCSLLAVPKMNYFKIKCVSLDFDMRMKGHLKKRENLLLNKKQCNCQI